jgi:peptidyl-prolyl cis-trans isomerase D
MLDFMRRKAGNWMIKFLLVAIMAAFALSFGAYQYGNQGPNVAVEVNEQPITEVQVRREQSRLSDQLRQQFGPQAAKLGLMKDLRKRAVENLVLDTLRLQTAQKAGIAATPAEVRQSIAEDPAFQNNGRFDRARYQWVVSRLRMSEADFELTRADEISKVKLATLVMGAGAITPEEVDQRLKTQLAKVKAAYVMYKDQDFNDKVKADENELLDFYEKNKRDYLVPEQYELSYLAYPWEQFKDQVDVQDSDIVELYEIERSKYVQPKQANVEVIILQLPENASQAETDKVKKTAEEVKALAEKPGADFAALSKKYGSGEIAERGGKLGWIKPGQLTPELDKLVFAQKIGEVGVVHHSSASFVVKVLERKDASITPLEEVRGEIRERLVRNQAMDMAQVEAEKGFDLMASGAKPEDLAKDVKRSFVDLPAMKAGDEIKELKGLQGLADAVLDLNDGEILPVLTYEDGAVVMVLKKRIPETFRPFEEVKAEVQVKVLSQKAQAAAKAAAQQFLGKLAGSKDAGKLIMERPGAKQTDFVALNDNIEGLDFARPLIMALMLRPTSAPVLSQPVRLTDGFAAAMVLERKEPGEKELAEQREQFKASFAAEKRREILQRFQDDLRSKAVIKYPGSQPAGS